MSTSRDPAYPAGAQDDEDLPRTLRRAKQEHAAQIGHAPSPSTMSSDTRPAAAPEPLGAPYPDMPRPAGRAKGVTVRHLDVPFVHLTLFFLKAVLAAIPALVVLGGLLWTAGALLKLYFPWIIQTEILIRFPA